jgi:hypothetical protein
VGGYRRQAEDGDVRLGEGAFAVITIRAFTASGHPGPVEADAGCRGRVPGHPGVGRPIGDTGRVADRAGCGDGLGQEFNVHVAGLLRAGWGDDCDCAVGGVGGRHGAAVLAVGDQRVHMEATWHAAGSVIGVCDARVGGDEGVSCVY